MQFTVILLILGLYLHDAAASAKIAPASAAQIAILLAAKVVVVAAYAWVCSSSLRRMADPQASNVMRRVERASKLLHSAAVGLYFIDLGLGVLVTIRRGFDVILLDECLMLLPTLLMFIAAWWLYYPVDRRMRESVMLRLMDEGQPVHPIWSRSQFITSQLRHQVAIVLAPLLLILGWQESVQAIAPLLHLGNTLQSVLQAAGTLGVFLVAPVIIRHLWDTVPIPPGELRQMLQHMCQMHHVGVRELLLWRTFGGMINAAVMGVVAPMRYILLTDALLDSVPPGQIEAVMAHELAHVRRRHMVWLAVAAVAIFSACQVFWTLLITGAGWIAGKLVGSTLPEEIARALEPGSGAIEVVSTLAAVGCWALAFGWVSRRFERQADSFAVQHLCLRRHELLGITGEPRIAPEDAEGMSRALQLVADLNHVSPRKPSWRHGSIAWRQSHLRSIIGRSVADLPIDRLIRLIKLGSAVLLVLVSLLVLSLEAANWQI